MYSQVGSRGLPWTSRKSSRSSRSGSAGKPRARLVGDGRAGPLHRPAGVDVERRRCRSWSIAAASWLPRTPSGADLAQPGDDRVRLRPVAHDVAQLPDLVDRRDRRQHRVEGRYVGMDVRQDGDAHRGSVAQRDRRRALVPALHNGRRLRSAGSRGRAGVDAARRARRRPAGGRSSPATPGSTISTRPARSAASAGAAAASSASMGSRFQATRTPPGATSGRPTSTSSASEATARVDDRGPGLAVARVVRERLRADRLRRDPPRRGRSPSMTVCRKPDLLGDRVDEQRAVRRAGPRRAACPGTRRRCRGRADG